MISASDRVLKRIRETPELAPHRATLLAELEELEERIRWLATCDLSELLAWAEVAAVVDAEAEDDEADSSFA